MPVLLTIAASNNPASTLSIPTASFITHLGHRKTEDQPVQSDISLENLRQGLLRDYLTLLFQRSGSKAILGIGLLIVTGLTGGVGLLMLIPFLQMIGIVEAEPTGIVAYIGQFWKYVGLPMNLTAVLLVYAGVVSMYAAAQRASTILNSKLSHAFTRSLRNELFEAMARVEWLRFTRIKASDINHIMTANLTTVDNGTYGLYGLIGTVVVVAVHIGVAMTLSVPLTGVALGTSVVLLLLLRPLNRQSYRLGEEWRGTMSALFGVLMEHLGGMKVAKSFGAESRHVQSFSSLSIELEQQANRYAGILSTTQMYYDIGGVAVLCMFFYVAVEVLRMPAGKLLIIVYLFASLIPQFSWMQRTWQGTLNMLPAFKAVTDMLERFRSAEEPRPTKRLAPVALKNSVELQQVSFKYHKNENRLALDHLDLIFPAFCTTVILGPSGGGKSTLADMLIGLLRPDEGVILIDGAPLEGDLIHAWRLSVGYVPQESVLFHETIRENLLWVRPEAEEKDIWEALRLAAADGFISRLPEGLDTIVGDRGVRISGGERQRIALARALLRKPTLLLLDEATSQLDRENEKRILDALVVLRGKMTVIFISHRLSAARCADRVVIIDGGRVAEAGAPSELVSEESEPGNPFLLRKKD
jgi:ATP-binding cassette, subfamily C, bacterial